ncbi:MAG: uracil phosphoribosyltransferase [Bacillota bacterium]|nr:uracil phosphoribosyltransferase [Bacillota bacterium]
MENLRVITHPLVQHYLTTLRDKNTGVDEFRRSLRGITTLLAYEATREVPTITCQVETPMGQASGTKVYDGRVVLVAIFRAALGMVEPISDLVPGARIGHLGIFRDERTLEPNLYYTRVPSDLQDSLVLVLDPMLATGGSLVKACGILKERGARRLQALTIIAAPEGIAVMAREHPDVPVYTANVDERLNSIGYIVPGLGDAGDRQFGTFPEEKP